MKQIWRGRMIEVATRYGESTPMVTTCCNACRTCVATNIATLALGALAVAVSGVVRFTKRFVGAA